jgi:hypothetical protein
LYSRRRFERPALTGRPAEEFTTIVARRLNGPGGRASLAGRAAALARLTKGMLRGRPQLNVLARSNDFAMAHGTLAADSPRWQRNHEQAPVAP